MNQTFKKELPEEFTKLRSRRSNQANEDLKSGLLVDLGSEEDGGEEVKLDPERTES